MVQTKRFKKVKIRNVPNFLQFIVKFSKFTRMFTPFIKNNKKTDKAL